MRTKQGLHRPHLFPSPPPDKELTKQQRQRLPSPCEMKMGDVKCLDQHDMAENTFQKESLLFNDICIPEKEKIPSLDEAPRPQSL